MTTPSAPIEVIATKNSIATLRSATTASGANGTTSQTSAAGMNMAMGAPRKTHRSDPARPVAEVDVSRDLPLRHREDGREVEHEQKDGPERDEQPDRLDLKQVEYGLHLLVPPAGDGVD